MDELLPSESLRLQPIHTNQKAHQEFLGKAGDRKDAPSNKSPWPKLDVFHRPRAYLHT